MSYSQKQVLEVLYKHPSSNLWNVTHTKWSDEQRVNFEKLKAGVLILKKDKVIRVKTDKKIDGTNRYKRVRRISDGIEFKSIQECAKENYLSEGTISRHVNNKFDYVRFEFVDKINKV